MPVIRLVLLTLSLFTIALLLGACGDSSSAPHASPTPRPIPSPVAIRPEPDGITLPDPAFEPLRGARADYGRLGGTVYQVEIPDDWNGRLVLFMHGFEDLRPEAGVGAPDMRRYLIGHGYAWGASSFSSTSLIPGRAADETAALWDFFAQKYGRPTRSYVTGFSMGGAASHIAAERYGDRFDGSLALCGSTGNETGAKQGADYFAAGAYVAGVKQAEFDAATDVGKLIGERILPVLQDPAAHERFESIMLDLTGGPRAFDRDGFRVTEETNWRRTGLLVASRLGSNADRMYQLGPLSTIASGDFNRDAVRLQTNDDLLRRFTEGNETTGELQIPLLTLHSTGDGQVPIGQARLLRQRIEAAGKGNLLVQRVLADASHCGFNTAEIEAGFEALVGWVEDGRKPEGDDVLADLRSLGTRFTLLPRGESQANAVPGASDRVVIRGKLTLDGVAFDANYLGAVVRREGLVTPCNDGLPPVIDGQYEIAVFADAGSTGCGVEGAEVVLWTFVEDAKGYLYSRESFVWPPGQKTANFDASFATSVPDGAMTPLSQFSGEVYTRDGNRLPPGTRIDAFVGDVRCGVASIRRTGNFWGYILGVVGPDSVDGCQRDATVAFHIDGQPAWETALNDGRGGPLDLSLR